jgi:hypothetical protein
MENFISGRYLFLADTRCLLFIQVIPAANSRFARLWLKRSERRNLNSSSTRCVGLFIRYVLILIPK